MEKLLVQMLASIEVDDPAKLELTLSNQPKATSIN